MSLKDKILGREELKRKIKTLEQKVEKLDEKGKELKRSADKERKRAKEAITEKQEVDRKLNKAKDKIKSLEGRLEVSKKFESPGTKSNRRKVSKQGLRNIIEKLRSMKSGEEDLYSIYLKPDSSISLSKTQDLELNLMRKVNNVDSKTGKVFFSDKDGIIKILINPPLPIEEEDWERDEKFHLGSMEKIIDGSTFGLVFLSSGGSALAKVGEGIEKFKKIRSDIKGQHSKGGFSQQRFQRNREKAVEKHLEEVGEEMDNFFEDELKYLMISGVHRHVKKFGEDLETNATVFEKSLNFSTIDEEKELKNNIDELWESEIIKI